MDELTTLIGFRRPVSQSAAAVQCHLRQGSFIPPFAGSDSLASVALDRSAELEQFAGELSAIAEEAQPETVHVIYCDSAVQQV